MLTVLMCLNFILQYVSNSMLLDAFAVVLMLAWVCKAPPGLL